MDSKWEEMRIAYRDAEAQVNAADSVSTDMARMLRGRLRKIPYYLLKSLKRELRDFNMHTERWRS